MDIRVHIQYHSKRNRIKRSTKRGEWNTQHKERRRRRRKALEKCQITVLWYFWFKYKSLHIDLEWSYSQPANTMQIAHNFHQPHHNQIVFDRFLSRKNVYGKKNLKTPNFNFAFDFDCFIFIILNTYTYHYIHVLHQWIWMQIDLIQLNRQAHKYIRGRGRAPIYLVCADIRVRFCVTRWREKKNLVDFWVHPEWANALIPSISPIQ